MTFCLTQTPGMERSLVPVEYGNPRPPWEPVSANMELHYLTTKSQWGLLSCRGCCSANKDTRKQKYEPCLLFFSEKQTGLSRVGSLLRAKNRCGDVDGPGSLELGLQLGALRVPRGSAMIQNVLAGRSPVLLLTRSSLQIPTTFLDLPGWKGGKRVR